MSKLHKFRKPGDASQPEPCPPPEIWGELAAGLMAREAAFDCLEHASSCPACAEELQYALFAMGDSTPVPEEILRHLVTGTEEWQRKFADQIAANKVSSQPTQADDQAPSEQEGFRSLLSRTWTKIVRKKKPTGR